MEHCIVNDDKDDDSCMTIPLVSQELNHLPIAQALKNTIHPPFQQWMYGWKNILGAGDANMLARFLQQCGPKSFWTKSMKAIDLIITHMLLFGCCMLQLQQQSSLPPANTIVV